MAYALIASVSAGSADANDVTTGSIDTTGATLLVASVASSAAVTFSDSKSNTWTALTITGRGRLYYVLNPTVGAGHTFTATSAALAPSIAAAAYSGAKSNNVLDQTSFADQVASSTVQPGSVTPTYGNELLVVFGGGDDSVASIDGGFTIRQNVAFSGGLHYSCILADLIQVASAAANPTVTLGSAVQCAAQIATFRASDSSQMFQVF